MNAISTSDVVRPVVVGKVSGGVGSFSAVRRHVDRHGTDGLVLLFTDTLCEDQDAYRFLIAGAANLYGIDLPDGFVPAIVDFPCWEDREAYKAYVLDLSRRAMEAIPGLRWLSDGRDPWDVYEAERFLGNSRADPCSKILKRQVADRWLRENCDPANTTVIVGIDYEEIERFEGDGRKALGLRKRMTEVGWTFTAPLCQAPYLSWLDRRRRLGEEGLWLPRLNALGFSHNNCFAGETEFVTSEGVKTLMSQVGKTVRVLGRSGEWVDADIRSFGKQKLLRLSLERDGAERAVYVTSDHRWIARKGRDGQQDKTTVSLVEGDELVSVFEMSEANAAPSAVGWVVVDASTTDRDEEVFCAVVEDGHCFALSENLLTGNCGGHCCKGGQGHWKLLLRVFPERYAYVEWREKAIRAILGDVSMMTDRRGDGEKRPLTLETLRTRDLRPDEMADMGACGCFFGDAA